MKDPKRIQINFCTTREAADMLGISLRTAQLWAENGTLEAWKTEGGHRRITRASIERLLADTPRGEKGGQSGPREAKPGFTILVVEDEPDLLRLYQAHMNAWSLQPRVITASNGFHALVMIGKETPDMLVLDLNMPGIDGFRLLRALESMPGASSISLVVVSGLDDTDIRSRGGLPGHVPVLPKPIPFAELEKIALLAAGRGQASRGSQQ